MRTPKTFQILFAALVFANVFLAGANAQTPTQAIANEKLVVPTSSGTAAEIQRINEEMTLLNAQFSRLELQAKIAQKQKELKGSDTGFGSGPMGSSAGNPSVVSVAGLKGSLDALLVFPGGLIQRVKVGDVIGDRKVAIVAINEVVLTDLKGKSPQRLAFGTNAAAREQVQQPNGQMQPAGMPPLPLLNAIQSR